MNTVFDKIYCITLDENVNRQNNIKHIFNDIYNIDFDFFYSFPFKKSVYSGLFDNNKVIPFGNYDYEGNIHIEYDDGKPLSTHISNYLTVLNAYKQGANNVLIIEDDICLHKNIKLVEQYFNNIPEDADVIRYGYNICFNEETVNNIKQLNENNLYYQDNTNLPDKYTGAQMIALMNRKTMEIYCNNVINTLTGSDNVYNICVKNENNLNIYYSLINIALDSITYKLIQNNEVPPLGYYPFDYETIKKNINNYFENE